MCWRLSDEPDWQRRVESLADFMTNPAGAAIVNAVGPIRQIVQGEAKTPRRYLVIAEGTPASRARRSRCRFSSEHFGRLNRLA